MPETTTAKPGQRDEMAVCLRQMVADLYTAHDELLRVQNCKPEEFDSFDWPEWSSPANSIRWAGRILGLRFSKHDRAGVEPETLDADVERAGIAWDTRTRIPAPAPDWVTRDACAFWYDGRLCARNADDDRHLCTHTKLHDADYDCHSFMVAPPAPEWVGEYRLELVALVEKSKERHDFAYRDALNRALDLLDRIAPSSPVQTEDAEGKEPR